MAIGKIETEAQLLDYIREELLGSIPERLEQVVGMAAGSLRLAAAVATGRRIAFGTGTLSPAASTVATSANIPHGLGAVPSFVFVSGEAPSGFGAGLGWNVVKGSVDGTNLKVQLNASVALTDTLTYWWMAIT